MKRLAAAPAAIAVALFVSSCDTGARKDLPQENQRLVEDEATVYLQPDKFPNIVHRCDETTGMWTTTQGNVWIVYDDPACGATRGEGRAPIVLDNVPGSASAP